MVSTIVVLYLALRENCCGSAGGQDAAVVMLSAVLAVSGRGGSSDS